MSVPNVIFIDTNIFDRQNYNYESSVFVSFAQKVKDKGITLLLPHPMELEVQRHIKERVQEAINALKKAKHCAPFLTKWKHWPVKKESFFSLSRELDGIAWQEWERFLQLFNVVRLSCEHVQLKEVMQWYDSGRAPFGKGKKRKEFPDAFAIAAVSEYAVQNNLAVAVISHDSDMGSACDHFPSLLHFPSLPAYTEAILSKDKRLEEARLLLTKNEDTIVEHFCEAFYELGFYLEIPGEYELEEVNITGLDLPELRIVALGKAECTVAFEADISFKARFSFYDTETYETSGSYTAEDSTPITGTAKVRFTDTWDKIDEIFSVKLDKEDVGVELYEDPYDM